jgi:hypothetical protein
MMKKFALTQWSVKIVIDGVEQGHRLWEHPTEPFLLSYVVTEGPDGAFRKGLFTFAALVSDVQTFYQGPV